jgi:GTP-binding protein Era
LDRALVVAGWGGAGDGDTFVLVVDAANADAADLERILAKLPGLSLPRVLALNKVDRTSKPVLLQQAARLNELVPFAATFMVSALKGDGVADLKVYLSTNMPAGPWHYPPDEISDMPLRILAAEITREKIFARLHQELPYEAAVETTSWKEQKNGVRIEQTIYVERPGQKRIVLGEGGRMIKQLSVDARSELSRMLDQPVHLFLFVKVKEGWGDDPERYRDIGLDFPKK